MVVMTPQGEAPRVGRHGARDERANGREDEQVRIMAARLRLTTDSRLGKETPQWVKNLANTPLPAPPPEDVDEQVRILAARLRVTTDRKLGNETPQWVKDLAAKPLQ
ncbi:hypothetical protein GC088_09890 [Arthrobacter sp. JZ12]|nr:hypothetical protein GC088_09890 [Arthrobacter sp. JZ12]